MDVKEMEDETLTLMTSKKAYPGRKNRKSFYSGADRGRTLIDMILGLFRRSAACLGGYLWKTPYKLNSLRKRSVRERLKNVENIINLLNSTGIKMNSLDKANMVPRYSHLSPKERYTFFSRKIADRKPIQFYRHFTKVEIPTNVPYGYK